MQVRSSKILLDMNTFDLQSCATLSIGSQVPSRINILIGGGSRHEELDDSQEGLHHG